MNRRLHVPVLTLIASVLLVMIPLPAAAQTSGIERMEKAGWSCENYGPLGWHCWHQPLSTLFDLVRELDGDVDGDSDVDGPIAVPARVFMVDEDGHETYRGTELLIRADVFERNPNVERPCPQEGGHWQDLRESGFPLAYYGCHHFG